MSINITHDGTFDIATGKGRDSATWKNRQMTWSAFLEKISETHRTHETFTEYLAAKKTRQDEIKDIGGFVGGYLTGGRRKKGSCLHRQLLTLDMDQAAPGFWEDFIMLYGCAAAVYSTHKHSPDAPRLRLIIPLSREVARDEYQAIGRRMAERCGIEQFDTTTYQPERLMYWPSSAKDGVYLFDYQDGPWLDVDEVLATYTDWKDASEWPISEKENTVIERAAKKQGDPLEKPGVVGTFCRTYNIHEAIETFLSDVYEPCDVENRYTYKEGSTAAGLVVYDDKFAYSHHGTDPVSGKLCNAFDLVRIHRFGLQDEDVKEGTPVVKFPSYTAMLELATTDEKVKIQIGVDKRGEIMNDFTGVEEGESDTPGMVVGVTGLVEVESVVEGPAPAPYDENWMAKLDIDRKGNYHPTIKNIVLVLEHDPAFRGNICFDEFESSAIFRKNLPWRKVTQETRYMTNRDADLIEYHLETVYDIKATKLEKAISVICEKYSFHPVKNYLNRQVWDGVPRVDQLLIDYMGCEDCEYTRMVTRKTLVGAVARIFKPGIKFDNVLTAVGPEGRGKSTLFDILGGEWFTDTFSLHMLQSKDAYELLRGVWIVEIPELAGMAKAESERVKGFVAARKDRYRVSYGRRAENFYRGCIFVASTNIDDFLVSQSGNRRFWPVLIEVTKPVMNVFKDLTQQVRGQIWAEAMEMFRQGEPIFLPEHLVPVAVQKQKDHTIEHPWTPIISEFLDLKLPPDWNKMNKFERLEWLSEDLKPEGLQVRERVCIMEIWEVCLKKRETIDHYNATAIRNIMRNLKGWKEDSGVAKYGIYGAQRRGYFRDAMIANFSSISEVDLLL